MKSRGITSSLFLVIVCFFYASAFGQISQLLYQSLPDSLCPQNPESLTTKELQKLLNASITIKGWSHREFRELDLLCYRLGPAYTHISNGKERLDFLIAICSSLYYSHNLYLGGTPATTGRSAPYRTTSSDVISGIKYCDIYINELKKYAPDDKLAFSKVYFIMAFFHMENDNFLKSEKYQQLSLSLAKEANKPTYICKSYASFANFYNLLGLPSQALTYNDSAWSVVNTLDKSTPVFTNVRATILSYRQKAYLNLFIQQRRAAHADSIQALHEKISYDSYTKGRRKASSYIMLAGLSFYQRNYDQTLTYLNLAQRTFPDLHLLTSWQEGMVYKGVSLLRLGRNLEAKKVLGLLDFVNVQTPAVSLALQELIFEENRNKNRNGVLHYQSLLLTFNQKRHALEMQGKALEMSQRYSLANRDAQILQLTELKERDRWIAFFIVLVIVLLLIILVIRYLNAKAQTNRLIQQVEEITELQLTQIEEVQTLERKRIGQELHDELASSIAMASRYLLLKADQNNDNSDKEQTIRVAKALEESYNVTRMKSHRLFQEDNARLFCDRLAAKTELLFVGTPIQFTFTGEINGLVLSADFKTVLVLVLKEAMTNIIKHANASQVHVLLYYDAESLVLTISDNGKGISANQFTKGIGMKTIQSRITALGGTVAISSAKPTGTVLEIRIPIATEDTHPFGDRSYRNG